MLYYSAADTNNAIQCAGNRRFRINKGWVFIYSPWLLCISSSFFDCIDFEFLETLSTWLDAFTFRSICIRMNSFAECNRINAIFWSCLIVSEPFALFAHLIAKSMRCKKNCKCIGCTAARGSSIYNAHEICLFYLVARVHNLFVSFVQFYHESDSRLRLASFSIEFFFGTARILNEEQFRHAVRSISGKRNASTKRKANSLLNSCDSLQYRFQTDSHIWAHRIAGSNECILNNEKWLSMEWMYG